MIKSGSIFLLLIICLFICVVMNKVGLSLSISTAQRCMGNTFTTRIGGTTITG